MKRMNKQGFTLVEIMIVVAIIALLAAIAIPNLLRARVASNEALAQSTVRAMSTAAESYATANNGNYPSNVTSLTGATPPYLNEDFTACLTTAACSGYAMTATFGATSYSFAMAPVTAGTSGTSTYTITTGGVLTPAAAN